MIFLTLKCIIVLMFIDLSTTDNPLWIMSYRLNRKDQDLPEVFVNFEENILKKFLICLCDTTVSSCETSANNTADFNNLTAYNSTVTLKENVNKLYRENVFCRPQLTKSANNRLQFQLTCWPLTEDCHPERHDKICLKAQWKVHSRLGNRCLGYGLCITWTKALDVTYYNTSLFNITKYKKNKRQHLSKADTSCLNDFSSAESVSPESSYQRNVGHFPTTKKIEWRVTHVANSSVYSGEQNNKTDPLNKAPHTSYTSRFMTQTPFPTTDSLSGRKRENVLTTGIYKQGQIQFVNESLTNNNFSSKMEPKEVNTISNKTEYIKNGVPLFTSNDIEGTSGRPSSFINQSIKSMGDNELDHRVGASTAESANQSSIFIGVGVSIILFVTAVAVVVIGVRRKRRAVERSRRYSLPRLNSVEEKRNPSDI